MLKVTDYAKWRRTKAITAVLCFIGAVASAGGLESETGEGGNYFLWLVFMILTVSLWYNIVRQDKKNGYGRYSR